MAIPLYQEYELLVAKILEQKLREQYLVKYPGKSGHDHQIDAETLQNFGSYCFDGLTRRAENVQQGLGCRSGRRTDDAETADHDRQKWAEVRWAKKGIGRMPVPGGSLES
jgi:hypothetical protein